MGLENLLIRRAYRFENIPTVNYKLPAVEPELSTTKTLISTQYFEGDREVRAEKIAIIREGGIGDLIMLASAIRAMKTERPPLKITLATSWRGFETLEGFPYLDEIVLKDKYDPTKYHLIIDLTMQVEPTEMRGDLKLKDYAFKNRVDIFHRLLHVEDAERRPSVMVDETQRNKWQKRLAAFKPVAVIHATCTARARTIPPDTVAALAWRLSSEFTVLLVGSTEPWQTDSWPNLKELRGNGIINLIDQTSVSELIAIISVSDLVIAPDSSALHIAGALGIKTVGIFGNIIPMTRCKYYKSVKTIFPEGALDCIPCHDLWHCDLKETVGAPCMRIFSAGEIYNAAMEQ